MYDDRLLYQIQIQIQIQIQMQINYSIYDDRLLYQVTAFPFPGGGEDCPTLPQVAH